MGSVILIDVEQAKRIIETRDPKGVFILEEKTGYYTAIDNTTGHAWTEEFCAKEEALAWLERRD